MIILMLISKSATTAMLLTTFIPGGGQFYTERWVKGILVGGTQSYILYRAYKIQGDINSINREIENNPAEYLTEERDDLLIQRRETVWWGALVWTLGILDAYIDAQLYNFEGDITLDNTGHPKFELTFRINH